MIHPVLLLLLWRVFAIAASGQFLTNMQATSPDEFDAYLEVMAAEAPAEITSKATRFARKWPESQLRAHVYYMQMEAYRAIEDADQAIETGEKALEAAPDNLLILASLASILPNGTSDPQRLARAEECANRIFQVVKTLRLPRQVSLEDWEGLRMRVLSEAHAARGLVAHQRGDMECAIREFEQAVAVRTSPEPAQHYRLGLLYKAKGDHAAARRNLELAAASGNALIQQLAKQQLTYLGR
ncbi:MAG: hypothetical protein L0312_01915 [Acidobacteria bacterium]|nr:hypothetical protein [Acidobacteriota bacterium]